MSVRQEIKCGCTWLQACVEREREACITFFDELRVFENNFICIKDMFDIYINTACSKKKCIRMGD